MILPRHPRSLLNLLMLLLLLACLLGFAAAGTNEKGLKFLAENKEKPDVVTLESGLQYKILKKGRGHAHPKVDSPCQCHYEGRLIDGTIFDSSYERGQPITFQPDQVIKGWTEAMQLMVTGDKWELYIPSELGYGDSGSPPKIGGGDVLVFQMELESIMDGGVPAIKCDPTDKSGCDEREIKYIDKVSKWSTSKQHSEVDRMHNVLQGPMADDLRDWARRRVLILNNLLKASREEEL